MSKHAPIEKVMPFRDARGEGAIVFDPMALPQTPTPDWFDAAYWGNDAQAVGNGGRGAAWFIDAPSGAMVLRRYLRGGFVAKLSHDKYVWRGEDAVRSVTEFRLLMLLRAMGLPVPAPVAGAFWREGRRYRAAILLSRIMDVHSFGHRVMADVKAAPWDEAGGLIARFHRVGLDHPDLNAHNLLFDDAATGWMIDFDKAVMRSPSERGWRRGNLERLRRSLHKLTDPAMAAQVDEGFARLRAAYDVGMSQGATT